MIFLIFVSYDHLAGYEEKHFASWTRDFVSCDKAWWKSLICLNCVSGSQVVEAQQEIAAMLAGEGCEGRMPWWRMLVNGSGWLVGSLNVLSSWNNSPGVLYLSLFETMWDLLKHQGLKPHFMPPPSTGSVEDAEMLSELSRLQAALEGERTSW